MRQLRAHRLLSIAMRRLERGEDTRSVLHAIKGTVEELKDPFAGEIDDFLADRESAKSGGEPEDTEEAEDPVETIEEAEEPETGNPNEDLRNDSDIENEHPQDQAEDELDAETPQSNEEEMPGDTPQEAPQEELEDKVDEEVEEASEEKVDELEERKEDLNEEIDKVQKQTEDQVESTLRKIAAMAKLRGYLDIANKFIKASQGGVVEILNNLLMKEYLQRDIAINYYYLFDDSQKDYLSAHFESEKARIAYLQNVIISLGGVPTTQRLTIPPINPTAPESVMALNVEFEKQAVTEYLAAAKSLEGLDEYASLKVWLEAVAVKEGQDVGQFQDQM